MRLTQSVAILLCATGALAADDAGTNKTLVAWVIPANLSQRGGSVLTIQSGEQFDGIVLGEKVRGRWMAGSDYFQRTQGDQNRYPAETADAKTMVQIAIAYDGDEVRISRNGKYKNLIEVFANDRQAVVVAHPQIRENPNIRLFAKGGDAFVESIRAWKISTTYHAPAELEQDDP